MHAHRHALLVLEVWKVHVNVRDGYLRLGWLDYALVRRVEAYSLCMVLLLRYSAEADKSSILSALLLSQIWVVLYLGHDLIPRYVRLEMTR